VVDQGRSPDALLADFRADVRRGRLPAVSWIVAPEAYSEHPNWEPDFGAWYTSQVVDILASNPEVWSKMVLFVTYDEEGGFFDHLVPPTPPAGPGQGISTVPTTNEIFPGQPNLPAGPYGLGMRVPMIVVSPWTRGGWVNSQVFDHTSLIRFLETRFGRGRPDLTESNITPWRRAVAGDLTSAFDFRTPNRSRHLDLPDTDDFRPEDLTRQPDQVPVPPVDQRIPRQERGVRPARAIPYSLHADGRVAGDSFRIELASSGQATGVFQVRSAGADPRSYTVEKGKRVSDTWDSSGGYDLDVHGPNGFFRGFTSGDAASELDVRATYDERDAGITLRLRNPGRHRVRLAVRDRYGARTRTRSLGPGETATEQWSLSRSRGWYDLVVTVDGDPHFQRRYAGHVETGRDSVTDPAMGGLV
jgi:phospholipase C